MATKEETRKNYKKEILVGVITSLLSSMIAWFAGWILESAPQIGATLPATIENIIYTKAASVTEFTPFLLVLELVSIAVMTAVLAVVFLIATSKLRIQKDSERMLKKMIADAELEKYREESQTPEGEIIYRRKFRRRISDMDKESRRLSRKLWMLLSLNTLLIALLMSAMVHFVQKPIKLKEQFDLEIQIIAPYVEEDVITKLKSDWVLMYSKEQYLEIYDVIDAELEKQGISRYYWSTTRTIISGAETPAPVE